MEKIRSDILIAGGGVAGLAAAARLGGIGLTVCVVDPAPAETGAGDDRRTTAFLQPAVETLERASAWAAMAAGAAPLATMRLVDAGGRVREPRETADFTAREVQDRPFGYNVANSAARAALLARLAEMPSVDLRRGIAVTGLLTRTTEAVARLSDGAQVHASLAVAADGRDSTLRQAAGIPARRWHYGRRHWCSGSRTLTRMTTPRPRSTAPAGR
jgi:2-octaprenyl-6-methoxyphenol hydroxylase